MEQGIGAPSPDAAVAYRRVLALLYYHLAREVIETFGPEGRAAIVRALVRYSTERGEAIRARVADRGLPLSPINFHRFYDLPVPEMPPSATTAHVDGDRLTVTTYVECCPLAAVWTERSGEEIGALYCRVEEEMCRAYNPHITVVQDSTLAGAAGPCLLSLTTRRTPPPDR